jgi:hypothetical protein
MKQYEFTYRITQINLQTCDILVTYTPTQSNLTAYTHNIATYVSNEDGEPRTIEESVLASAPHYMWAAQELLLAEYNNIINITTTVTPT